MKEWFEVWYLKRPGVSSPFWDFYGYLHASIGVAQHMQSDLSLLHVKYEPMSNAPPYGGQGWMVRRVATGLPVAGF